MMSSEMKWLLVLFLGLATMCVAFLAGNHVGHTETHVVVLYDKATDQAWVVELKPGERGELNGIEVEVR
jgi:hypothetical protein